MEFLTKIAEFFYTLSNNAIIATIVGVLLTLYLTKDKIQSFFKPKKTTQIDSLQDYDYEAITEDNYVYISKNVHRFERKVKIKALKDNVRYFDFFMKWTGEKYKVDALIHGQKIIPVKVGKIESDTYHVMIPNVLKKNDICDIHLVLTCDNYLQGANSYFSKTIRYPIGKLNIVLFFDDSINVTSVLKTQDEYSGANNPKDSKIEYLNGKKDFTLSLENPIVGQFWTLSWE